MARPYNARHLLAIYKHWYSAWINSIRLNLYPCFPEEDYHCLDLPRGGLVSYFARRGA